MDFREHLRPTLDNDVRKNLSEIWLVRTASNNDQHPLCSPRRISGLRCRSACNQRAGSHCYLFNERIHEYLHQVVHSICPSLLGFAISLLVCNVRSYSPSGYRCRS